MRKIFIQSIASTRAVTKLALTVFASGLGITMAQAATIWIDEGFTDPTGQIFSSTHNKDVFLPGTAPTGWSEGVRDPLEANSIVSVQDDYLTINNINTSTVTSLGSNALIDMTGGVTVTMITNVVKPFQGTRASSAFGTGGPFGSNIAWSLWEDGTVEVTADVSGNPLCNAGSARCRYTLPTLVTQKNGDPYTGGTIELTLTADASGFRVETSTDYDTGDTHLSYGLLENGGTPAGVTFSDFENANNGLFLTLADFTDASVNFDRIQMITAIGADTITQDSGGNTTVTTDQATTTLQVTNGTTVNQTTGTTTVIGTLTVEAGSEYRLTGGVLVADEIIVEAGGTFLLIGGELSADDIVGDITNQGKVSPGNSPGGTDIVGNFVQDPLGELLIQLAGTNAVSEYDRLTATGTATLGGTLTVDLLYGITPVAGDFFDILQAASILGSFDNLNLQNVAGISWQFQTLVDFEGSTDVLRLTAIQAVPVPASVWLFGSALGVLGWLRRKRT